MRSFDHKGTDPCRPKGGPGASAKRDHNRKSSQPRKTRPESLCNQLGRCRAAVDQLGDDISGFAIVVWDKQGDLRSAYDATRGPIGPALVPTLVLDALNRHVAVKLAEERLADSGNSGN
jgi:hypothetical protein